MMSKIKIERDFWSRWEASGFNKTQLVHKIHALRRKCEKAAAGGAEGDSDNFSRYSIKPQRKKQGSRSLKMADVAVQKLEDSACRTNHLFLPLHCRDIFPLSDT